MARTPPRTSKRRGSIYANKVDDRMAGTVEQLQIADSRWLTTDELRKVERLFRVDIIVCRSHSQSTLLSISGDSNNALKAKHYLTSRLISSRSVCYIYEFKPENECQLRQNLSKAEQCSGCYIKEGGKLTLFIYGVNQEDITLAVSLLDSALTENLIVLENPLGRSKKIDRAFNDSDCIIIDDDEGVLSSNNKRGVKMAFDEIDLSVLSIDDSFTTNKPLKVGNLNSSTTDAPYSVIDPKSDEDEEYLVVEETFCTIDEPQVSDCSISKESKKKRKHKKRWDNVDKNVSQPSPLVNTQATTTFPTPSSTTPSNSGTGDLKSMNPLKIISSQPLESCKEGSPNGRRLRKIVIDGSNVAMMHGLGRVFSCRGIELVIEYFEKRGHTDIAVFVPQWRRSRRHGEEPVKDLDILEKLFSKGQLHFTPSREVFGKVISSYDDRFILSLATDEGGIVISNDQYKDLYLVEPKFKETIEKRILQVTFVGDKVMFPDDPLGRNGPNLEDFLCHNPPPRLPAPHPLMYPNNMMMNWLPPRPQWAGWPPPSRSFNGIQPMAFGCSDNRLNFPMHAENVWKRNRREKHKITNRNKRKAQLKNIVQMAVQITKNPEQTTGTKFSPGAPPLMNLVVPPSASSHTPIFSLPKFSLPANFCGNPFGKSARPQKVTESLKKHLLSLPYATPVKVDEVLKSHSTATDFNFLKALL